LHNVRARLQFYEVLPYLPICWREQARRVGSEKVDKQEPKPRESECALKATLV